MPKRGLITGILLASVAFASARPAHAEASQEDRAAADSLYEESARLMKAGRWDEACPKLEASQRIDPGIGTLIRLGYCYSQGKPEEGRGKTASAWAAFNEAEGLARRASDKRAEEAAKQAKVLEPRLSRLLLEVAPENKPAGVEIRRDGRLVDAGLWGAALPVDPGPHTLEATAPGKARWQTTILVEPTPGTKTAQVPVLLPALDGDKGAPLPFWGAQRIAGFVVGGAGLVGVAVALGFGAKARSLNNESLAHCLPTDPTKCYAQGVALRNQAYSAGDVATPTFIAGGIALAAGTIAFFLAPSGKSKPAAALRGIELQPSVGAGSGSLTLRGAW